MFPLSNTVITTLLLGATGALALAINTPVSAQAGEPLLITWSNKPTDKTFTIELVNPAFENALGIANNVDPAQDALTVTLPIVPAGDGYTLEFVSPVNVNDVFATNAEFSIAPAA